jgi:hypothetical protein
MKWLPIAAVFATIAFAQYSGPKIVYILPMASGLDQYLAQRLTQDHILRVTADPKAAEVFMTDRLGEGFEQKLRQIRPAEVEKDATKDEKKPDDTGTRNTFRTTSALGTVFLVDAKSHAVLWSDYEKPGGDRNRIAERIARALSSGK